MMKLTESVVQSGPILIDFSKQNLSNHFFEHKKEVADTISTGIDAMFNGQKINNTENRRVLHTALRNFKNEKPEGQDIAHQVATERNKIKEFCQSVHQQEFRGITGNPFKTIVNIGIGGSDLGPAMAVHALKEFKLPGMQNRFINNLDPAHVQEELENINPEETLFIVVSKTFTTLETITNATYIKSWLEEKLGNEATGQHFVAVSTNLNAVREFGIQSDRIFTMWDWTGGRFSMWSPVGLSIALTTGYDNYEQLLRGAGSMDDHFRTTPVEKNLPAILALISHHNVQERGTSSEAYLPYDHRLQLFVDWYQQLAMESNGKSTRKDGTETNTPTCPVIWGGTGTVSQHSFFQLLHQGTSVIPCTFLWVKKPSHPHQQRHQKLINNAIAQAEALHTGRPIDHPTLREIADPAVKASKSFPGNRPSTTIVLDELTPYSLGYLLAMYEHVVFVQGLLWQVNSFDQFGVELGKEMAQTLENATLDDWTAKSKYLYKLTSS